MEVQSLLHYSSAIHTSLHRIPAFYRHSPPPLFKRRVNTTSSQLQALTQFDNAPTSSSGPVPTHKVTVHDRQRGLTHHFFVPEDISLPFACRHGCCTSCAVRVKSGELRQPEALGISAELKSQGYALLCVGYPSTDLEVETQDEDEVYWLQFGRYFARGPIERDDYALELAMGDE
ncbi:hypothetical protein KSS87_021399 [Heliosperma pusillum]|nr:hypothetical protein KSS87_021399 [Heliosperma pusillum]